MRTSLTTEKGLESIDVTAPETIELKIRDDGKVIWINVNGICMFRACQIGTLELQDAREGVLELQDTRK